MRNGLNIAGVSELVHEIQAVPAEALVRLGTRVAPLTSDASEARTLTLFGGTVRVARDFRFLIRPTEAESERPALRSPACHAYLLAALGGCVLVTFVQGCSARAITIMRASVEVTARMGNDPAGRPILEDIAYGYDIDCDGAPDVLIEIARYVSCLSPNHRAFLEPSTLSVDVSTTAGIARPKRVVSSVATRADGGRAMRAEVKWVYGAQLLACLDGGRELLVDQPKQFLGLDSSANPQEYLLAAAAAEFAHALEGAAGQRGAFARPLEVGTYGWLDLRGLTNIDETKPVRVHDIEHRLQLETDVGEQALDTLIDEAASNCVAHAAICRENKIQVTLVSRGEKHCSFESNRTMLAEYLSELARRKQAAAAKA